MSTTPEQLLKAQQDHLERLMCLSKVLLDSTEKVSQAGLASVREQIEALHEHAARLADAKSPQEWYEIQMAYLSPVGEKAKEQVSKTYTISKETAQEIAGIVETQISEFNHKVNEAFNQFASQWPQGNDQLSAAFNSLMAAGTNAYNSAHQALKQAADMAEKNAQAMQASFTHKD